MCFVSRGFSRKNKGGWPTHHVNQSVTGVALHELVDVRLLVCVAHGTAVDRVTDGNGLEPLALGGLGDRRPLFPGAHHVPLGPLRLTLPQALPGLLVQWGVPIEPLGCEMKERMHKTSNHKQSAKKEINSDETKNTYLPPFSR